MWNIVLENGDSLQGADEHILIDENYNEVFIKDCIVNKTKIMTRSGPSTVVRVENLGNPEHMYDVTVDSEDHRFWSGNMLSHNTTTATVLILHYILFNEHKSVALLANKGDTAREILSRIKLAYEALPMWLQQGIVEWNKGSIELENGCKVFAGSTSSSAIRGRSISLLYIDECAFVENWNEFFASVYPTISSGKETRIVLTSTPNGMNHFHSIIEGGLSKTNNYQIIEVKWDRVPGRDEAWKQETLASMNFNYEQFAQEYECEFQGSSGTLIDGWKLKELSSAQAIPINTNTIGMKQYKMPIEGNNYVCVVDVSRGKGLDYSAFQIIDVTKMPYEQVCTFRDNMLSPVEFTEVIYRTCKLYNECAILVEINDIGGQVADLLYMDYEYENILSTSSAGRNGKRISAGFGKNVDRGIRTTKTVKSIGCSILKLMIEQNQLIIRDHDTIEELSTFSRKGNSYEAESGKHDDLVMCLVLFAWLSDQAYFKELTDINTLNMLREKSEEELMNELVPFGFIEDGIVDEPEVIPVINDFQGGNW